MPFPFFFSFLPHASRRKYRTKLTFLERQADHIFTIYFARGGPIFLTTVSFQGLASKATGVIATGALSPLLHTRSLIATFASTVTREGLEIASVKEHQN